MGLLLKAVDVVDERRWRWLLVDEATGAPLADHAVAIDPASAEAEAFSDLYRYVRWNAEPDRRAESEASIVDRVGAWAGEHVLGASVGEAIAARTPVTVRVQAGFLLTAPLELAHVGGTPLARRGDVTLVHDVGDIGGDHAPAPAGRDHLRMVAVFSLPTETTALALRRERYELSHLVRRLAARTARNVQLEVLQYGVTRDMLRERMTAAGGPDILHLSGHGASGLVLLETGGGEPDPVDANALLALLRPAQGRLRLAVLSACQSAAATTAQALRLLDLDEAADEAQSVADADETGSPVRAGLAEQVARQLGCAVVAMRYPVIDEFAIAFASSLYEGMFALDLPVDRALARAVPAAAGVVSHPVSPATPAVLGATAIGMFLTPPHGRSLLDPAEVRMASFPDEPVRFVGRAAAMARASRALATGSGQSGVLFHGMAGAGKTSCALELAYRHRDRFAHAVWWQAPLREEEWAAALTTLALAWEAQLPGFTMADKIGTAAGLQRFLPRLRALLRDNGVLIVLDNLETLLTPAGQWRDPRWASLIDVLANHGGESRTVLTSRVKPAGLPPAIQVEPVHALSRDESVLLARELPHLRTLLDTDRNRGILRRILRAVQGHPKLLELADAAAADPDTLAGHLADGDDQGLNAFFTHGESTLDETGFLNTLAAWTRSATRTLPEPSQLLLQMLAGMEDGDRRFSVVDETWPSVCHRLDVEAPNLAETLAPLTAAALIDVRDMGEAGGRYLLHPGIAETIRATTPAHVRDAIDTVLGVHWALVALRDIQSEEGEHTGAVVRAGLAAVPYLLRRDHRDEAAGLLDQVIDRDDTLATTQIAIAHMRRITEADSRPEDLAILGKATARIDLAEGQRLLRTALARATADGNHRVAASIAGVLVDLLRSSGRLREALELCERVDEFTRRARLGPWTRLADHCRRLQIVHMMGGAEQVLTEVRRHLTHLAELPERPGDNEVVSPWNVRESLLNLGVRAAGDLERWQEALEFNAHNVASMRARGAGAHTIAAARFNDYGPLLNLGRLDETERLLLDCRRVLEAHHDIPRLANLSYARATLAEERGHHRDALDLYRAALRLGYTQPDPEALGTFHAALSDHLEGANGLAHRLAAAIIWHLTARAAELEHTVHALASERHELLPRTVGEVAEIVERVEGVRFMELVSALPGDPQEALDEVLAMTMDGRV